MLANVSISVLHSCLGRNHSLHQTEGKNDDCDNDDARYVAQLLEQEDPKQSSSLGDPHVGQRLLVGF